MTYPTPKDEMPDEWVAGAEALEKALNELGVVARVEARNNGTPGSDLLIVFFSFFLIFVDRDNGRWVFGVPNPSGGEMQWFDDLKGFQHIPARALAIQVVARSTVFFMTYLDQVGNLPQKDKEEVNIDQDLLLQLTLAMTTAKLSGHWLENGHTDSEEEDHYLTMFAQIANQMVAHNLYSMGIPYEA